MHEYVDWIKKLNDGLIEQFRGHPKIAVFNKAVARQFEELYAFFYQLYVLQWLDQAEGAQLDGIGNIVGLSRTDALIWSSMAGQAAPMDDGLFRLYLRFKIFLNTSNGTYSDIVRTLKMFWPHTPLFYSEHVELPATMIFTTPTMPGLIDISVLQIVSRVKAAGVSLQFVVPIESEEDTGIYHATGAVKETNEFIVCDDVPLDGDFQTTHAAGTYFHASLSIICDGTPLDGGFDAVHAAGAYLHICSESISAA